LNRMPPRKGIRERRGWAGRQAVQAGDAADEVAEQGAGHAPAEHLQADAAMPWSARKVTVTRANRSPSRMPPAMATMKPRRLPYGARARP